MDEWTRHDRRYRRVARAVMSTLILASVFVVYLFFTKEIRGIYVTEPWKDDPYDALRTFDFIAIPVPIVLATWRFLLSAADSAIPVQRIIDLARTCYLLAALVLTVIASDWLSVILRTDSRDWTSTTLALIGSLAVFTAATIVVLALLFRARQALDGVAASGRPDWLGDGVHFLRLAARAIRPARRGILVAADWIDREVAARIRRHPLTFLAMVAVLMALLGDAHQIVQEGYGPQFATYFLVVSASSYYAFFAIVSRYLNLIATPAFNEHPIRLAGVTTAASIPLTEAFRQYLGWIIGVHGDIAVPTQLYVLTLLLAAAAAATTLILWFVFNAVARSTAG